MTEQAHSGFVGHLIELRNRLMKALLSTLLVFIVLIFFMYDIYDFISAPLVSNLPSNTSMIATDVTSVVIVPIKLTLFLAFLIAIPMILHQVWGFIAPGLYQNEKKMLVPILISSVFLFYGGVSFCYFVVLPMILAFFTAAGPEMMTLAPDIGSYLSFVIKLFYAFGIAFEIPVAIMLLCWSGATTTKSLKEKRPYIVVGVFVVAMFLTPPDVLSQTLLALPMLLLFELGLILAAFYTAKPQQESEE
ncbi:MULTISPECIES: twin-arginine translocase subunit TatC [Pseudoalteromonas]|jgi:sec-independent protein translocase protein TatC|uniref:Sec-independent protein translocase protein TatC n=1 Tax=Pseudoalteromonas lipolytica TaxID=570156 RepID=A0AAD0S296_9GAMM|nr:MULTISPECIES: twin-arginine translocase subunit TatC [Pseudoalteromonas]AXV66676.1 twin-arginine translocase subunit TatC [Pseudoalteromonas donghaensis]EWH04803.1 twin-arginine protein translocation system subunit TatC [Pseudoalteromonas lipolytica SCSIO 04301]MCC9661239.1 twin-arginine translocase subunit TatC [Pseudoalteromonas sp. MB41]QLJ08201.1 twin-arginine translocase subunit TatC [Pseudoalteromonas sp. JSTW]QMW14434.1 twin-arginine translocase subunit TatC [Pseudoalteromonas sp. MT|tara:strand:- start:8175 stop:8915 length:741 start_codon:yes stop_codon:yes gene_type:complete